jgi:hypothetical protein
MTESRTGATSVRCRKRGAEAEGSEAGARSGASVSVGDAWTLKYMGLRPAEVSVKREAGSGGAEPDSGSFVREIRVASSVTDGVVPPWGYRGAAATTPGEVGGRAAGSAMTWDEYKGGAGGDDSASAYCASTKPIM